MRTIFHQNYWNLCPVWFCYTGFFFRFESKLLVYFDCIEWGFYDYWSVGVGVCVFFSVIKCLCEELFLSWPYDLRLDLLRSGQPFPENIAFDIKTGRLDTIMSNGILAFSYLSSLLVVSLTLWAIVKKIRKFTGKFRFQIKISQ